MRHYWAGVIGALALAMVGCAPTVLSEQDLRVGLTRADVEQILGQPVYARGASGDGGSVEEHHFYVSESSGRLYEISFRDDAVESFQWQSVGAQNPAEPAPDGRGALAVGQSKTRVRALVGPPGHVSGSESETVWWYYVSADEIYLVLFRNDTLTAISATSVQELRAHQESLKTY